MIDLSQTIIAKSDQLNSDDLIGSPRTIKISKVSLSAGEQPVSIAYEGDKGKPWKPCKSMMRVLVGVWGSDGNKYVGRSLTLYRDEAVTWAGQAVGGIRISHMSDIDKPVTMSLTATRGNKKPFTVKPLSSATPEEPPIDLDALKSEAEFIAGQGSAALKAWWTSIKGKRQTALADELARLKEIAAAADAPAQNDEELPL